MRKILTLVLLLSFACSEETEFQCESCINMTISDALPIQFWKNDCPTYNEKESCGVHSFCWTQKFHCDDEIRLQLFDSQETQSYALRLINDSEELLSELFFDQIPQYNGIDTFNSAVIAGGVQMASGISWIGNTVDMDDSNPDSNSKILYVPYTQTSEQFKVGVNWALNRISGISGTNQFISVITINASLAEIEEKQFPIGNSNATGYNELTFSDSDNVAFIGFRVYRGDGSENIMQTVINSASVIGGYSGTVYNLAFTPSELSPEICNEKVQFQIVSEGSPEEVAKSDFVEFSDNLGCTVLAKYRNQRNFAGIDYANLPEDAYFYKRIPAVFFHEQFPGEDEQAELSDSKIIALNGVLRAQKLLDTDYMPYHEHKKNQLILKHQFVEIDGDRWTKQDAYEIAEGNKRYPLKKATCWLTNRDFVARNVI